MLGILIVIALFVYIGKSYYTLAFDYKRKHPWMYPIIGIATYYGGTFIGGLILGIIIAITGEMPDQLILALITIPVGIAFCWGLYLILKFNWKKEALNSGKEVLDNDLD